MPEFPTVRDVGRHRAPTSQAGTGRTRTGRGLARSAWVLPAVTALAALLLGACVRSGDQASRAERPATSPAGSSLRWSACTGDRDLAGLQCATLTVPLDHDNPGGRTIELALARRPASGKAGERIGSLVVNPGGPGASGVELVGQLASAMDERVLDRFDLVGFDPRGVDRSAPVDCIEDKATVNALDGDPDTPAEIDRTVAGQQAVRDTCLARYGDTLPHLSTAATAADLDLLRAALGDAKLTYLGFSYGTEIGSAYARRYPNRIRALVLDGAVAPDLDQVELARTQAEGFERAFANFADRCRTDRRCAAGPDARALHERVRARVEQGPIPVSRAGEDRDLAIGDFQMGVVSALYDQALWAYLARGLAEAAAGDGSTMLALADLYQEPAPDGSYPNSADANLAITCADTAERYDRADAERLAAEFARTAPTFGAQLGWSAMSCDGWPAPQDERLPVSLAAGTAAGADRAILVVGTVNDPATPYAWAQRLTAALAPAAQLLTWEGEGHTAYLKSDCVSDAVDAFLLTLKRPADGTRCAADTGTDNAFAGIAPELREVLRGDGGLSDAVADCVAQEVAAKIDPADLIGLYQGELSDELQGIITRATTRCVSGR